MKAIINGKRYDTSKATLIYETSNCDGQISRNDFRFWEAGLYVTPRSGSYFLAGRGGAMSRFAVSHGQGSWSGGSGIHPLSADDAFAWAQDNMPTDLIEKHFADRIEDA